MIDVTVGVLVGIAATLIHHLLLRIRVNLSVARRSVLLGAILFPVGLLLPAVLLYLASTVSRGMLYAAAIAWPLCHHVVLHLSRPAERALSKP